ncbi:hypothetical protein HXX76_003891 [Chlamydomonas incerta]|uniref:Tyrosine specific protein phosphatases domain-containing protein n=1 Tax=Chlamydomonas incerta TaxID=51695 RepID=A0A835T9C1_CHLIN|nr:hypothetical protein HXX76_003891 [Chlamydomonas incerta]|eukprot:KAG2441038.1 hypothetical protein HXX76_003891 [Chlamydomonas incerta]
MADNKPTRRSCEEVDIDPGWYPGQPELEDDPTASEFGTGGAASASRLPPEASLPSAGAFTGAGALSATSAFSNASSLGPAAAAAAAAMAGGGGGGDAARARAPAAAVSVPTVLGKLQKWGDYVAVGAPVAPTKFVPMKTPLSTEILDSWSLPAQPKHRLTVPQMVADQAAAGRKIGLILDLSNHDCLYTDDIPPDVQYIHIQLVAKELPPPDFVAEVVVAANAFWERHPDHHIAVHCAYGFNRTGFVVCCYLIECCGLTVDEALAAFAAARPPGVKHEAFRAELQARYAGCSGLLSNHASGNSFGPNGGGAHHGSPDNSSFGGCSPSCRSLDLKDMVGSASGPCAGPNSLSGLGSGFGSLGGPSGPSPLSRNAFAMESLLASVAAAAAAGTTTAAPVTPGPLDGSGGSGSRVGLVAALGMPGRGACSYGGYGGGHGAGGGGSGPQVAGSTASGSPRPGGSGGLALGGGSGSGSGSHGLPPWAGMGGGAGAGGCASGGNGVGAQQQQPHGGPHAAIHPHPHYQQHQHQQQLLLLQQARSNPHHQTHTFLGVGALGGGLIVSSVPPAAAANAGPREGDGPHDGTHGAANGIAQGAGGSGGIGGHGVSPDAPWHAAAAAGGGGGGMKAADSTAFTTASSSAVALPPRPSAGATSAEPAFAPVSASAFAAAAGNHHAPHSHAVAGHAAGAGGAAAALSSPWSAAAAAFPCSGHGAAHAAEAAAAAGHGVGGLNSGVSAGSGGRRFSDERTSSGAYGDNESLGVNDRYILTTMRQHAMAQQQGHHNNANNASIPEEDGGGGGGGTGGDGGGGDSSSHDSPLRGVSSNSLTDYSDVSVKPGAAAPAPSITPPRTSAQTAGRGGRFSRASLEAIDWGAAASEAAVDAALTAAEAAKRMVAQ